MSDETNITVKVCKSPNCEKSNQLQPLENFNKSKRGYLGYFSRCKVCVNKEQSIQAKSRNNPRRTEGTKVCSRCKIERDVSLFRYRRNAKDGLTSRCILCDSEVNKAKDNPVSVTEKACTRCGELKKASEFSRAKSTKTGLMGWCRECNADKHKERVARYEELGYEEIDSKTCLKCNINKPVEEYYKRSSSKDGLDRYCIDCVKAVEFPVSVDGKICCRCNVYKKADDFAKNPRHSTGIACQCKSCKIEVGKEGAEKFAREGYTYVHEKKCTKCGEMRNRDEFQVTKSKSDGLASNCKHCDYERHLFKLDTDVVYKLKLNLRRALNVHLRKYKESGFKKGIKSGSFVRDLGCTIDELVAHFELKFYDNPETGESMTWDNYGRPDPVNIFSGWQIDHIIPLASFDLEDREQFLKACHYTNLQPLWAKDNLDKRALDKLKYGL